ncbi:MaoC family dehydratase [Halorubellus sp. JP-L1]|uniref:MaoC family dehydratase n=1 Tax=Halorubellus sp. JP-L1 TaxID=2715753 RepID=UPI001407A087|nr:MaoC family dehydratase [Halorubellus sp. JP-L1]NHN42891.1 MaoC family dehydratase [Halorubellus sp. JP-L1]
MTGQYYEDLTVGETHDAGPRTVTDEEIIEFAEKYDPQSFHVDREAADASMFGGLAASGWHTASVAMRLLVDGYFEDVEIGGALGVDDLRWRKPVYAGDELSITVTVADKEIWDDDRGRVEFDLEAYNQDDVLVHSRTELVLVFRED